MLELAGGRWRGIYTPLQILPVVQPPDRKSPGRDPEISGLRISSVGNPVERGLDSVLIDLLDLAENRLSLGDLRTGSRKSPSAGNLLEHFRLNLSWSQYATEFRTW